MCKTEYHKDLPQQSGRYIVICDGTCLHVQHMFNKLSSPVTALSVSLLSDTTRYLSWPPCKIPCQEMKIQMPELLGYYLGPIGHRIVGVRMSFAWFGLGVAQILALATNKYAIDLRLVKAYAVYRTSGNTLCDIPIYKVSSKQYECALGSELSWH